MVGAVIMPHNLYLHSGLVLVSVFPLKIHDFIWASFRVETFRERIKHKSRRALNIILLSQVYAFFFSVHSVSSASS